MHITFFVYVSKLREKQSQRVFKYFLGSYKSQEMFYFISNKASGQNNVHILLNYLLNFAQVYIMAKTFNYFDLSHKSRFARHF